MNALFPKRRAEVSALALSIALVAGPAAASAAETNGAFTYLAYRFAPDEGWRVRGGGDLGATRLEGRVLHFDFTKGAAAIALGLPDRVLLGKPEQLRLRVRGSAQGHPVRVQLRTHFMTFAHSMGIMTRDLRPKPAYAAFATLARVLKGLRFAGPASVTASEGPFAYRFAPDPNAAGTGRAAPDVAEVIAVWSPKQAATITLPVRGSKATLVNTVGEERALDVRNGQGQFPLSAGKAVYVRTTR